MNQEKIGKFISELRKENNMTQEQLAEKVGVTDKSISRWENGNTMPDISILVQLSEILNTTLPELINGRKMTKDELLAQKETINNLIKLETENQVGYNQKALGLLSIGISLTTLELVDNNIHYLEYIFTQNASQFVDGLMVGLAIVFNICGIYSIAKYNKKEKEKVKLLEKKKK